MTDKTMVADTLAGINGELVRYGEMISQTEKCSVKTGAETDAEPVRDVSGGNLSDRQSQKLLCAGGLCKA